MGINIKTGVDGCIRCDEITKFSFSIGKGLMHSHHINPTLKNKKKKGRGESVSLCALHHSALHRYYMREAYDIALKQNPSFFEDILEKYIKEKNAII